MPDWQGSLIFRLTKLPVIWSCLGLLLRTLFLGSHLLISFKKQVRYRCSISFVLCVRCSGNVALVNCAHSCDLFGLTAWLLVRQPNSNIPDYSLTQDSNPITLRFMLWPPKSSCVIYCQTEILCATRLITEVRFSVGVWCSCLLSVFLVLPAAMALGMLIFDV